MRTTSLKAVDISKDGNKVYLAFKDAPVQVWDISDAEYLGIFHKIRSGLQGMKISKDGNRMFVLTDDGYISVVDTNTEEVFQTIPIGDRIAVKEIVLEEKNMVLC